MCQHDHVQAILEIEDSLDTGEGEEGEAEQESRKRHEKHQQVDCQEDIKAM